MHRFTSRCRRGSHEIGRRRPRLSVGDEAKVDLAIAALAPEHPGRQRRSVRRGGVRTGRTHHRRRRQSRAAAQLLAGACRNDGLHVAPSSARSAPRLNEDAVGERIGPITLATSSQPCCQCYGATIWAGIDRLLIGARSEDVESLTEFDEGPLPADWVGELETPRHRRRARRTPRGRARGAGRLRRIRRRTLLSFIHPRTRRGLER